MTTSDPTTGRIAATRRPRAAAWLCAGLLGAACLPALAQQAPSQPVPAAARADLRDAIVVLDTPPVQEPAALDRATLLVGSQTVATPATAQATTGSRIQSVLKRALALLGTPYRWGGTTTDGFDCSGLVGYVFRTTLGIDLPRVSRDMARSGELVDRASLSPGDLVFFGRRKGRVDHVGIYLGEGRFVHAPRTGRDVTVSQLDDGYWGNKFLEARRVAGI